MMSNSQHMLDLMVVPILLAVVIGMIVLALFFVLDNNWKSILATFRKIRRLD